MRVKKLVTILAISAGLAGVGLSPQLSPASVVQAATNYLKVKGTKKVRLYSNKGEKTKSFAYPNKKYRYTSKKNLKVGKKKHMAYRLHSSSKWILAQNVVVNKAKKTKKYQTSSIKLPAGYTRASLLNAFKGKPSQKFIKACMIGMAKNTFSSNQVSENKADDQEVIDLANLNAAQTKELADYSLRLINGARQELNLPSWQYSQGVQKLANDIASEYQKNNRSIKDGDHYVAGIVRACKKNGLNLNDNYVEDMAGSSLNRSQMTMTQAKKLVYFGLKQMIFGYAGSSDTGTKNKSNYREWGHAGDLFNTQGSKHDGDFNYYGFSVSKTGNVYSLHYISVPSFIIKDSKYNQNFKI